jgi:hypothetical protein
VQFGACPASIHIALGDKGFLFIGVSFHPRCSAVKEQRATLKRLGQIALVLVALLMVSYAVDWVVLRVRLSHGTAYRIIKVNQFLASPLKGSKVEYDWMGTVDQQCSRSLYPQNGDPACWWLERHTTEWQ